MKPHYRQGDVLIVAVERMPRVLVAIAGRLILAHGEQTGHVHEIMEANRARAWSDRRDDLWLEVDSPGVNLAHREHRTVFLPPGQYRVVRQRQYLVLSDGHSYPPGWHPLDNELIRRHSGPRSLKIVD